MTCRCGFTWWELLVLVLITAVLTGITIPKFQDLIVRSKEANTKAGLASLRSALQVYFSEHNAYPSDNLDSLAKDGKYIPEIPITQIPGTEHKDSNAVLLQSDVTDIGGWIYYNDKADSAKWGTVIVNCTHKESMGAIAWNEL